MHPRPRQNRWKVAAILFVIFTLVFLIALAVTTVLKNKELDKAKSQSACDTTSENILLAESEDPDIFRDLTQAEQKTLLKYLHNQKSLKLKNADTAKVSSSYIFTMESLPPNKYEAIKYLDDNGEKPERWAKAVLFRGDLKTPQVEEYKVGPLPDPTQHVLLGDPINFAHRPITIFEFACFTSLMKALDKKMSTLLLESYGRKFYECADKCLTYYLSLASNHIFANHTRYFWFSVAHSVQYYSLNNVDLHIMFNADGVDPDKYRVVEIWYGQQKFDSVDKLMNSYINNAKGFRKYTFKAPDDSKPIFSNLRIRGKEQPKAKLRPPTTYEPDGKRYNINDQKIEYMGWEFNYRQTTSAGPALYNVKYQGERIAYEISLQEIAVFYAAHIPTFRFADFLDSSCVLGSLSKSLVPGTDCPEHATFMPAVHMFEAMKEPIRYEKAICVFEHTNGVPMHRHHSYSRDEGAFYGGMLDYLLTVRTILTVVNYDYILDFNFHQNGAIEVKVHSTGYIVSAFAAEAEKPYGWALRKHLFGPLHHHMFHYKVDLDIKGTSNRFEKLDILPTALSNDWSPIKGTMYHQIKYKRNLIKTEDDARYKYDFNKPTYLLFHNDKFKTHNSLPKSYRLNAIGISKSLLPIDQGSEVSISWARQQVAVTTYKANETKSSSIYSMFNTYEPKLKFDKFIDNESIVDQDLVAWVTLGVHHIPHTEDLPITPTAGSGLSFTLTPYNYYEICPSMSSRDGVFVELDANSHAKIQDTGVPRDQKTCKAKPNDFMKLVANNPKLLFSNE